MSVIDQISADVFTACDADLHGVPGRYYVLNTGVGVAMNIVLEPSGFKSVFDTGSAEIDFDIIHARIGKNELSAAPLEQGRGTVGDTFIFDSDLSTRWHVKLLGESADLSGAYYSVALANYEGSISGV